MLDTQGELGRFFVPMGLILGLICWNKKLGTDGGEMYPSAVLTACKRWKGLTMAIRDPHAALIHCKIAYYGPGMAGKTTNLQTIHSLLPPDRRGDLLSIATETERTLFFECTPADVPAIRGHTLRFHLYAVPGCVLYQRTRLNVLQGADGIVFVADSQREKLQENIKSLQEMVKGLYALGQSLDTIPIVLQYNKRDVPNAVPVAVMDKYLNPFQWPRFESSLWWRENDADLHIRRTVGVIETFQAIQSRIRERLQASAASK